MEIREEGVQGLRGEKGRGCRACAAKRGGGAGPALDKGCEVGRKR